METPFSQKKALFSLFHHIALPPQLPQRQEHNIGEIELALVDHLINAVKNMRSSQRGENYRIWDSLRRTLESCKSLSVDGHIEKSRLMSHFKQMQTSDLLILHLATQNAGIFIHKPAEPQLADTVLFELFEASPKREAILEAKAGTVSWTFPGVAIHLPCSVLNDSAFVESLATFIEQASVESTKKLSEYVIKAGTELWENRETPDPSLITSLLAAILEANGTRISPTLLQKRVRDEVLWSNAQVPWRRLPLWLVFRVSISRYLAMMLGDGQIARVQYKAFMCLVHASLLNDAHDILSLEDLEFLKAKLCRRLFKLDRDRAELSRGGQESYDALLNTLMPLFNRGIQGAIAKIENVWEEEKKGTTKRIPPLPSQASQQDLQLSLTASRQYLRDARVRFQGFRRPKSTYNTNTTVHTPKQHIHDFAHSTLALFELEDQIFHDCRSPLSEADLTRRCLRLREYLLEYIDRVKMPYNGDKEQKSLMLLIVMEIWKALDEATCSMFPLLLDFHPVFPPRLMEVLHFSSLFDIARARKIQRYLHTREEISQHKHVTIFDEPAKGCFAERYFDESPDAEALADLLKEIQENADEDRQNKEREWLKLRTQYDALTKEIESSTCVYLSSDNGFYKSVHDPDHCPKCQLTRRRSRIKIRIFESPLPESTTLEKVVVFELRCPRAFSAYRDATWEILYRLATDGQEDAISPRLCLGDYSELQPYSENPGQLSLASTSKSFLMTHWSMKDFPVDLDQVCLPNNLKFAYFDQATKSWPGRKRIRPSFAHHCRLEVPKESPFFPLLESRMSDVVGDGPSSYEIVASQSSCPQGLNVNEFMAFQSLLSGKRRRWITILIELGSSNLNLASEAAVNLLTHLALQIGPPDGNNELHGCVHGIFRDISFCSALLLQLEQKLEGIASNWRETYLMEIVMKLTTCLITHTVPYSGMASITERALEILTKAREFTLQWVRKLQQEMYKINNPKSAQSCQTYMLWAALLCKNSFIIYLRMPGLLLDREALAILVECCITAHDNIPRNIQELPIMLRNSITRDLRMMHELQGQVADAMELDGKEAMLIALHNQWAASESKITRDIVFEDDCWVRLHVDDVSDEDGEPQVIGYNYLHGVLLVDGEPLGRLSTDSQSALILKELFGAQTLKRYPSRALGMSHALTIKREGYTTHVGYEHGSTIIRAIRGSEILEFIPRTVFQRANSFDLPSALVDECIHWLDVKSGILHIRSRAHNIWKEHPHQWKVNLATSICSRSTRQGIERLVDPHCALAARVSRIFENFEARQHLTIYQPHNHALTVDLPRMQLRWFVNKKQLLQSPHLFAELDEDQCVGTWFGFDSKLVCRSVKDPSERSILVPLGETKAIKRRCHVQVYVLLPRESSVHYFRFSVNNTLGRIDCAAEPTLVYKKAEIHALTNSPVADPLTGRTGAEEALCILSSGICQPWSPLAAFPVRILQAIAKLSPKREYYPEDMRLMSKELWDRDIPSSTQREEYQILVDRILRQSNRLATFYPSPPETPAFPISGVPHLNLRALLRRQLHRRYSFSGLQLPKPKDIVYVPRDRPRLSSMKYANVFEIASLIREKPSSITTLTNLAVQLSQSLLIKGYLQPFDKVTLSDRLDLDVRQYWGPLVEAVREVSNQYSLMFFLGTISFRNDATMPLIRTLVAIFLYSELQLLHLPKAMEYHSFRPHQAPQLEQLVKLVDSFKAPVPEDPPLVEFASAKHRKKLWQARAAHDYQAEADCKTFAQFLLKQWPCQVPSIKSLSNVSLINIEAAYDAVLPEWQRLYHNYELSVHLDELQHILTKRRSNVQLRPPAFVQAEETFPKPQSNYSLPNLSTDLMGMPMVHTNAPTSPRYLLTPTARTTNNGMISSSFHPIRMQSLSQGIIRNTSPRDSVKELSHIVELFLHSKSAIHRRYAAELQQSLAALRRSGSSVAPNQPSPTVAKYDICKLAEEIGNQFNNIERAMSQPSDSVSRKQVEWLKQGNLWPAVTRITLLEQLRSTSKCNFGSRMKENIIQVALTITELQRQVRLESYLRGKDTARLEEEKSNVGHRNWRPEEYPDWLLLEIESNLLIRETQVDVARAIIAPRSGECSVLQLNMGQGKTSCIIPMVACVLGDGKSLVRISIPKALLQQTAQLLHTRLGGLIGREISHVPFSRRTETKEENIKLFHRLHRDVQKKHGILLTLPEHQLSFMLSGIQRVLDNRIPEASMMIRVQKWIHTYARDVLDESDHTLAVKTQLIYPSGSQMAVDGHPHRWLVAEQLLHMVDMHLYSLELNFPHSIEVVRRPQGGFPFVFFLRTDVEDELVSRLKRDICQGSRGIIPMESLDIEDRLAIKEFLSGGKIRPASIDRVRNLCPDKPHLRQIVYLLRGLFVHRILIMTLKKRYGVQYGIHPSRVPVAVPFHAKGVPSEQSEFGHVDVAILLTCLAFYHGGIDAEQTRQALESVLKSDDPASEYDKWTDDENFPDYLRDWHSINVDDAQQLNHVWNCVRYKVVVIDYYMNHFVFPQHAKQFKVKLQSNGWDIPLFSSPEGTTSNNVPSVKTKRLTTGFSGTSDECANFPLTIRQDDLPSLAHTNAEVLTYLLQQRSRRYVVMEDNHKRLSEGQFLGVLRRHNIRILIDAGAQILEMNNLELAQTWLKVDGRASVALFFNGDKPYIISKQGVTTPLLASPYADNLGEVLVYLDEAHTRGTDLKFGPYAKAALTLGLGQTKDSLVQAAMRLRQLGTTQAVTFFAPPEVNQSIRDLCNKMDIEMVDSRDVIHWLLHNTCNHIVSLQPLFYAQGVDFCNRMQASIDYSDFLEDDDQRTSYIAAIRQTERQTLQQLYAPQTKVKAKSAVRFNPKVARFARELESRRKDFQDTGQAVHASALQEVEQEREIEYEVEAVRQVKKPSPYTAHRFPGLHKDIEIFAKRGRIPAGSSCFIHIFNALSRTSLGRKYKINQGFSSSPLFVSAEFEKTVKFVIESMNDNFMRPVQWILYCPSPEAALVVTPEEAEILLSIVRKSDVPTFLLTYAAPVTRRMLHFNQMKYYTIPSLPDSWSAPEWLTTELGFFAGRLYFEWPEYSSICRMLGIDESAPMLNESDISEGDTSDQPSASATESGAETTITIPAVDGQQDSKESAASRPKSHHTGLTPKPFTFTQDYLSVRRRGQEISHTPMGFLCMGKPLDENHAFFRKTESTKTKRGLAPVALAQMDGGDEERVAGDMEVGEYDPSAALQGDEEHEEIEYDESELYHEEEDAEAKPAGKARRNGRP